jgi:hypothetical protein
LWSIFYTLPSGVKRKQQHKEFVITLDSTRVAFNGWLPYATIPACLWSAPVPRLGLMPDWNLMWHYYRRRLSDCDWVVSDTLGAERLNQAGLSHVRPGNLCGCESILPEEFVIFF